MEGSKETLKTDRDTNSETVRETNQTVRPTERLVRKTEQQTERLT